MIDALGLLEQDKYWQSKKEEYLTSRYLIDCGEEFETASKMWLKNNPLDEVIKREKKKMNNGILMDNTILAFGGERCKIVSIEENYDPVNRKRRIRVTADVPDEVKLVDRFSKSYDQYKKYVDNDIRTTNEIVTALKNAAFPSIKKVHFNPPVTVVLWDDNTKTIVRCENEDFDPEKGLAMAIAKKTLGNKGNYFDTIKKWVKPYEEKYPKPEIIKINSDKPSTFEFKLVDVDINELGKLVGANPNSAECLKMYFANRKKEEDK